jgi:hypothetical protein
MKKILVIGGNCNKIEKKKHNHQFTKIICILDT